jgi:Uncharacterized protein conserved in bacteria
VTWLRPEGDDRRYDAVLQFRDPASLTRWMASPQRAEWERKVEDIATASPNTWGHFRIPSVR